MNGGAYLVILFLGAVVVVVDGQLILRTGPAYLSEVYHRRPARKVSLLVTVFFHLIMLGVVALVASIGLELAPTVQDIVRRIGVILLLTAVGHVVAVLGLSRLRHEQQETTLVEDQIHHHDRSTGPGGGSAVQRSSAAKGAFEGSEKSQDSQDSTDAKDSSASEARSTPAHPQPLTTRSTDPKTPGPRRPRR